MNRDMTEIEIKQLETERRFSESGLKLFYLLLYTPFGLIICILRVILGFLLFIFGNVLPDVDFSRNILSNLFRAVFGIVIHIENDRNKANAKVLISNCISPLDHYVVHMATGCIMSYPTTLPSPLSFALGLKNFGSTQNLEELKKSIAAYFVEDTTSVLFQPENRITNGKAVLKFKDWPFGFINEVQPMYLQLRRPIFDISVRTITSSYWSDIFWYLFSPWTVYNVCFLPVVERDDATDTEFAEKVRRDIAAGLQVEACSYSVSDIIDWEKRYLLEKRRARMVHSSISNTAQSNNPELHRMARQVKEVLPTVPYNVIFKDLARTKNVDITISNILEGHVPYTPEAVPSVSSAVSQPSVSVPVASTSTQESGVKDSLCTAASTFPKSAQERMQSFQERKQQLIMNARKRYMDKHGLTALASNDC